MSTTARLRMWLCAAAMLAIPVSASAQETVEDIIGFLMTNQAIPTDEAERDRAAALAARDAITRALLINLATVPIATSSSGFLYRFNPELGTMERATENFGGFFVERALTPGRGRASFGVSASTSLFSELDGRDLRSGTFLTIAQRLIPSEDPQQVPYDTESLTLRVQTSTLTLFASVGVTDRLEIGGAVPLVRLTLEGERVNVYHGARLLQASASAMASGIADAAIRAKYTLFAGRVGGLALAGEWRLPTGDERNLLGAGRSGFRLLGIATADHGPLTVVGNAALARRGASDEMSVSGALAAALHPRFTVVGEFVARHIADLPVLDLRAGPHPTNDIVETVRLVALEGGRTISSALAGVKWNATRTVVLTGNVRWSMTDAGLTARITPTLGLEYAF